MFFSHILIFWVSESGSEIEVSSDILWQMRVSKEQKWIQTHVLLHCTRLNLEPVCEWTAHIDLCVNLFKFVPGSKIRRKVIISISLHSFCAVTTMILLVESSLKRCLLLLPSHGASKDTPSLTCLLWGRCKIGDVPSGGYMILCFCRISEC
jgi:hypothetical protein